MQLKESLLSLLGEFVAIQKTPDFKLSSQSNLSLNAAVREEKRKYSVRIEVPSSFFLFLGLPLILTVAEDVGEKICLPEGSIHSRR